MPSNEPELDNGERLLKNIGPIIDDTLLDSNYSLFDNTDSFDLVDWINDSDTTENETNDNNSNVEDNENNESNINKENKEHDKKDEKFENNFILDSNERTIEYNDDFLIDLAFLSEYDTELQELSENSEDSNSSEMKISEPKNNHSNYKLYPLELPISQIHEIISTVINMNVHDEVLINKMIIKIRKYLEPAFCNNFRFRKYRNEYIKPGLKEAYNTLDQFSMFFEEPKPTEQALDALNSLNLLQIYIILYSSFSNKFLTDQNSNFRIKSQRQKDILSKFPENANNVNWNELKSTISNLSFGNVHNRYFYRMKTFFKLVFNIYEGPNIFLLDIVERSAKPLTGIIKLIKKEFEPVFKSVRYIRYICSNKLKNIVQIDEEKGFMKHTVNLINLINLNQAELKYHIITILKDQKILALFIKYRISNLLILRLFILSTMKKEVQACFEVFKNFLEICDTYFTNFRGPQTESEIKNIKQNDEALLCIMLYVYLNFIKIYLLKIDDEYRTIHNVASRFKRSEPEILKLEFKDIRQKYISIRKIIIMLDELIDLITAKRKTMSTYIDGFAIGDNINAKVRDILRILLDRSINIEAPEIKNKLKTNYNDIISLHKDFFALCENLK